MYERILTIKDWDIEDRPREKFLVESGTNLSNAELIAILIGSGNKEESAVHLALRILESIDNDLERLALLSIHDLASFKGIGLAKAVSIVAAIELCYRRMNTNRATEFSVETSEDRYALLQREFDPGSEESNWVFLFSNSGMLLHKHQACINENGFEDPSSILKIALEYQAKSLMLVRYTVTRWAFPQREEKDYVIALVESAGMLSIKVLDQMVLYPDGYFSFKDSGLFTFL